jgi:hypothetical protein
MELDFCCDDIFYINKISNIFLLNNYKFKYINKENNCKLIYYNPINITENYSFKINKNIIMSFSLNKSNYYFTTKFNSFLDVYNYIEKNFN